MGPLKEQMYPLIQIQALISGGHPAQSLLPWGFSMASLGGSSCDKVDSTVEYYIRKRQDPGLNLNKIRDIWQMGQLL